MKTLGNLIIGGGVLLSNMLINPVFSQENYSFQDKFIQEKNFVNGNVLNIYYKKSEHLFDKKDSLDLKNYLDKIMNSSVSDFDRVVFTGYTDMVGDELKNDTLGFNRASFAENVAKHYYPDLKTEVKSYGEVFREEKNDSTFMRDRRLTIAPYKKNNFDFAMRASEPDSSQNNVVYLIDISGSTKYCFDYLRNYEFPENSEIWVCSRVNGRKFAEKINSFQDLDIYDIRGGTCYFLGAEDLFSKKKNSRIKAIFNEMDNSGGPSSKRLVEIAQENNLIIDNTAINPTPEFSKELQYLSHMTGGSYIEVNGH